MNANEIAAKYDAKKSGNGWAALCPAHDDKNASLTIAEGEGGRVLVHCHAGCALDAVLKAKGLTTGDLFPPTAAAAKPMIAATYDYTDAAGKLLFQVVRYTPKNFRQRRPDADRPGEFVWNMQDVERVLYRLPKVAEIAAQEGDVFIVEGEKDADALAALGVCATCNPGGAGKWQDPYTDALIGAHVIIIADKDEPGRKHAAMVAEKLTGKAAAVAVVELPNRDGKPVKDAADWIAAGGTRDELEKILENAVGGPLLRFADLKAYQAEPEKNHIVGKGLLRRGAWALLTGSTGIGKSILVEQFAASVAAGLPLLGCIPVFKSFRVLLVEAENDVETLQRDFLAISEHIGADENLLNENLRVRHLYGVSGEDFHRQLDAMLARWPADLIIVDNYQAFSGCADINSTAEWGAFIHPLQSIIARHNCALLLVDHTGKPQDRKYWTESQSVYLAAGTSRKANGARCSCELTQCGEGDPRYRLRFGKNPERTGLVNERGGIVRDLFLEHSPTLEKPYWKVSDGQDAPTAGKHDASIRQHLKKHPAATDAEAAAAVGCDRSTVYRYRQRAGK